MNISQTGLMELGEEGAGEETTKALLRQAAEMCKREHDEELRELGLLPPSSSIDPLNPPLTMCET
jgi:hypothetical protein